MAQILTQMSKDQQLNFIREKCIAANPEIVELKFGCGITWSYDHYLNSVAKTRVTKNGFIVDFANMPGPSPLLVRLERDKTIKRLHPDEVQVLGRPIRLADVLLTIPKNKSAKAQSVSMNGDFFDFDEDMKDYNVVGSPWNLRADDLEKQSEETINFIYELLK
jgi:hypothetical protein